ncbi:MAG: DUF5995 family protein [Candidatus Methylomirabilales bacterium]
MQAKSIDEVIEQLDNIIEWARGEKSRLGYFAALYRKVTLKVREGIADGFFDDGERVERLDVGFANRYLDAFERYRTKRVLTRSWKVAFDAAKHWWPIVLQHLLLGMNAHINLDLGIAAARTSPGDAVLGLKNDFNKINEILAALVDGVERELAQIWPVLGLLDRIGGRTDEAIINFSMEKARDHAWKVAETLALLEEPQQMSKIDDLDKEMAALGLKVRKPGLTIGSVTKIIRLRERGTIPQIIDILR